MKRALVMGVVALLLSGCGHAATPKDPFVGTWLTNTLYNGGGSVGMSTGVVITKSEGGYRVVRVFQEPGSAAVVTPLSDPERRGETLFATETLSRAYPGGPMTIRWALTYYSNPKSQLGVAVAMYPWFPEGEDTVPSYVLYKTRSVSPSP